MTPFSVAIRIWFITIILNALFVTIANIDEVGSEHWFTLLMVLLAGLFISFPLLLVITPLVKYAARLPYNNSGRLAFLVFSLLAGIVLFYSGLFYVFNKKVEWHFVKCLSTCTGLAMLLAVTIMSKSFKKISAGLPAPLTKTKVS